MLDLKAGKRGDATHDIIELCTEKIMKLIKRMPKDGGSCVYLRFEDQLECYKKCNGVKDVYRWMAWSDVAPTITSGCFSLSKGRFLHPEGNRALTIREAALLQGFPRRYRFPITRSKSALALMIDNALPPPFIAAHGKSIRRVLQNNGGT